MRKEIWGRAKPAPIFNCHGKAEVTEKNTVEQRIDEAPSEFRSYLRFPVALKERIQLTALTYLICHIFNQVVEILILCAHAMMCATCLCRQAGARDDAMKYISPFQKLLTVFIRVNP